MAHFVYNHLLANYKEWRSVVLDLTVCQTWLKRFEATGD
jgi:hypothetical protein